MASSATEINMTLPYYLAEPQKSRLTACLEDRQRYSANCIEAMAQLNDVFSPEKREAMAPLLLELKRTQGRFLAMMQEASIDGNLYHSPCHANEMREDIYIFTFEALKSTEACSDEKAQFFATLASTMGAAHDIIQNCLPPENEELSEQLFLNEINKVFANFISQSTLPDIDNRKLRTFQTEALPVIARECINHGTYLLVGHPEEGLTYPIRDFAFVLNQAEKLTYSQSSLNSTLRIMQLALSLCDVRHSELNFVVKERKTLQSIPPIFYPELNNLLKGCGLISQEEEIQELLNRLSSPKDSTRRTCAEIRLNTIEGFLIRMGQNLRMQVENEHKFRRESPSQILRARENAKFVRSLRFKSLEELTSLHSEPLPPKVSLSSFFQSIAGSPYSEAAFAEGLGKFASEILNSCNDCEALREFMVQEFDPGGWQTHSEQLSRLSTNLKSYSFTELTELTKLLFVLAAQQTGRDFPESLVLNMEERLCQLEALYGLQQEQGANTLDELKLTLSNTEKGALELDEGQIKLKEESAFSNLCRKTLIERINNLKTFISQIKDPEASLGKLNVLPMLP